jgi:hypothetical protein
LAKTGQAGEADGQVEGRSKTNAKNMSRQAQIYYAKKFYPHFLLNYGVLAIRASLETFKIGYEPFLLDNL